MGVENWCTDRLINFAISLQPNGKRIPGWNQKLVIWNKDWPGHEKIVAGPFVEAATGRIPLWRMVRAQDRQNRCRIRGIFLLIMKFVKHNNMSFPPESECKSVNNKRHLLILIHCYTILWKEKLISLKTRSRRSIIFAQYAVGTTSQIPQVTPFLNQIGSMQLRPK